MTDTRHDRGVLCYKRFLSGDESALAEIIEIYSDGLLYYINSFIGCLPYSEEVLSDTFLQLVIKRHNFREESSFKTYLYSIARNKSLDFIRRMQRRNYIPIEEIHSFPDDEAALEERVIGEFERREVRLAMLELSDRYREILFLVYFEELSPQDAGKVMKMNRKQIENLIYRARLALKSRLAARGISRD